MSPAVRVKALGKSYRLGVTHAGSLRELANRTASRIFRQPAPRPRAILQSGQASRVDANGLFWALRDVSFDLQPGEATAIIGRNGAGKSTLLKILSRVTYPTTGQVEIDGRIASLLEVGTGFHPELTGRENVYLNGTILGMTRAEISRKFDEIVAFSGVEQFMETPVKRYSSGMTIRLAFAVAAHLDSEILVVDEVLAVGDIAFQRKCIGKMEDVGRSGRTILFVSHNLGAVKKLCSHGIWLEGGSCRAVGNTDDLISAYVAATSQERLSSTLANRTDRRGTGRARIVDVSFSNAQGKDVDFVRSGEDFTIRLRYELAPGQRHIDDVVASIGLSVDDSYVWVVRSAFTGEHLDLLRPVGEICCHVSDFAVADGSYQLEVYLSHRDTEILDNVRDAVELRVEPGDFFGTGSVGIPASCRTLTRAAWTV